MHHVSFLVSVMLCCEWVHAQGRADSVPVRVLEPVTVQEYSREHAGELMPMQVIGGERMRKMNNLSVADAIRFFSGVQLKDYGGVGGLKTINVRSLGSNHTGVFYDGVELGNAQNGQVDLGKYSLDEIESVELYDGQKNTIFQPAKGFASGNALYLNSRKPQFKGKNHSGIAVGFKTGSFGLLDPSIRWDEKFGDRITGSVSTEWIHSSGQYRFRYTNGVYDTTAVRHNGDLDALRAQAAVNGTGKDSSLWSVKVVSYHSARGLPGAVVANKFDYSQRQWDRDIFIQSSYQKSLTTKLSVQGNIKYANDYTRYTDPQIITTTGQLDNHYAQQEWYTSLAAVYKLRSWWAFSAAGDYQIDKLDANLYHFAYPLRQTFFSSAASEWKFAHIDVQATLLGTFVNDQVRQYQSAGKKQEYSPGITFSWQPLVSNHFHVRGFYKKSFRMPTFNDLYYTFSGNTSLRPEHTWQYDVGMTFNKIFSGNFLRSVAAQADGYYNKVDDKIVGVPGANLFRWTMYNIGRVDIRGVELSAQAGAHASAVDLSAGLSYTYQRALDMTSGDTFRSQIPYTPIHSGSVIASADYHRFSINYSFLYTGSRYSEKANIDENYLEPWYTHDVSLGWEWPARANLFKANITVNNVFNQHYEVIANFPMPGRSIRLSVKYEI